MCVERDRRESRILTLCGAATICRLGSALVEALDELIQSGHINPQLALQTLNQVRSPSSPSLTESSMSGLTTLPTAQFDKSASQALTKDVKAKATVKAHLSTYRHLEDVRTFFLVCSFARARVSSTRIGADCFTDRRSGPLSSTSLLSSSRTTERR